MVIKITECECMDSGRRLLIDMANYEILLDWVQALVNQTASYIPLDCYVIVDATHKFWLYRGGELDHDDSEACIRCLKRRSKLSQRFPRDYGFVHADMFERELCISLINQVN